MYWLRVVLTGKTAEYTKQCLWHNNQCDSRKSYAIPHFSQRLCRWAFHGLCCLWRHKPFNQHHFRPQYFWRLSEKSSLSHFPNKAQIVHYGYYLDPFPKMAHRGNTGFHRGKRMLPCVSVKLICAFFSLFSVFALWHNGNLPSNRLFSTEIFEP